MKVSSLTGSGLRRSGSSGGLSAIFWKLVQGWTLWVSKKYFRGNRKTEQSVKGWTLPKLRNWVSKEERDGTLFSPYPLHIPLPDRSTQRAMLRSVVLVAAVFLDGATAFLAPASTPSLRAARPAACARQVGRSGVGVVRMGEEKEGKGA